MRILHIDTGRTMRGGQYQVLLLHDTLAERDLKQTLLAGDAIRSERSVERATWRAVRQHARTCDLIHAHDARAHTLAALHGTGKPVVVSRRVSFAIGDGFASRWKYRKAAHFVAISKYVASVLRSGGVPADKISVVYDAAPGAPEAPDRPSGTDRDRSPRGRELRVVSPNFDDPLKCRDLAVATCLQAGVPLRLSDDLPADLRSADALLYLSKSEGLGSALLLAMSLGVPAIASAVGGIPEVVSSGKTGLLVENDVESISLALSRLQSDPPLRLRMAQEALKRVRAEFSRERMADRTMQVYRRVLGQFR